MCCVSHLWFAVDCRSLPLRLSLQAPPLAPPLVFQPPSHTSSMTSRYLASLERWAEPLAHDLVFNHELWETGFSCFVSRSYLFRASTMDRHTSLRLSLSDGILCGSVHSHCCLFPSISPSSPSLLLASIPPFSPFPLCLPSPSLFLTSGALQVPECNGSCWERQTKDN